MIPSRCAYCGALAETPARLAWVIAEEPDEESLRGSIPLCVECSQSWCPSLSSPVLVGHESEQP